ncbi:MAG: hypothetical protein EXR49_03345 [Dehalococcoidia bacterium]|nr:hypothetical protein [Dehalococcoidia bacterium]
MLREAGLLFKRMLRVALFDNKVYGEMRGDPIALTQAVLVLLLACLATVAGAGILGAYSGSYTASEAMGQAFLIMPGLWFIQAASAYVFGNISIDAGNNKGSRRDLLTAIGYSTAPGVLFFFAFFLGPPGVFVGFLITLYMLATMIAAVKSVMDVSAFRALAAVAPGYLLRYLVGILAVGPGPTGQA